MRSLEIFISHSAKDEDTKKVLEGLSQQLRAKGFDVLLDRERLAAGQEWRSELFSWLKSCHCAVILFSKDAINSSWVLQETTILNWRRSYEQEFVIIPVYLNVKLSELDTDRFAALDLSRLQGIKAGSDDADEIDENRIDVDSIVEETVLSIESQLSETSDQVAAICYKHVGDQIQFLLIRTSSRKRWIVPKGWTRTGDPAWRTAELEARQEAGVAGDVDRQSPVHFRFWKTKKHPLTVAAFPLKVNSEFEPGETYRAPDWYTLEDAQERLSRNRTSGRHLKNAHALHAALGEVHERLR